MTLHRRIVAAAAAVLSVCASALSVAAGTVSLTEVLEAFRATGVVVIYSSDFVRPDLRVALPLKGIDAKARAIEALAAYGLELQGGADGRYLVIRAKSKAPTREAPSALETAQEPSAAVEEVSVYASRFVLGESLPAGPASLTRKDVDEIPGTEGDALRAARVLPGLASNVSSRPYIRGSRLDDLLVEFDGVPLADPFHLKNFQSLISAVDTAAVERIEVYSGGFPVRYGTRSGGVIDIAPRVVASGSANSIGASLLSYDASTVGHSGRWPVDWLVSVRHSTPDIVVKPVNGDIGDPQFTDTLGRVRWLQNSGSALTLGWLLLDDRIQLATDPSEESATARYRDEYGWLAYDWHRGQRLQSRTAFVLTNSERERAGDLAIPGIAFGNVSEGRSYSNAELESEWQYEQSDRDSWSLGFEIARAHAELEYDRSVQFSDAAAAGFGRASYDALTAAIAPSAATYAMFASLRHTWSSVVAEFGVRLDGQRYSGYPLRRQTSPRLNIRYDFASSWRLFGSWGQFDQAQRVDEWRTEEAQVVPDPAEHAIHTVVGLEFQGASTRLRMEIYRKHWTHVQPYFDNTLDALSLLPDIEPDRVRLAPDGAESAGLDLSVRHTLARGLDVWGAYSWSRVADEFAEADVRRSWDQPQALSAGIGWTGARATASLLAGWHRGWPRTSFASVTGADGLPVRMLVGERNSGRWGDYFTLDLRATWTQPFARGDFVTSLEVTNATNRDNECCVAFTSIDEPKHWLPETLNLGLEWRFGRKH